MGCFLRPTLNFSKVDKDGHKPNIRLIWPEINPAFLWHEVPIVGEWLHPFDGMLVHYLSSIPAACSSTIYIHVYVTGQNLIQVKFFKPRLVLNFLCGARRQRKLRIKLGKKILT